MASSIFSLGCGISFSGRQSYLQLSFVYTYFLKLFFGEINDWGKYFLYKWINSFRKGCKRLSDQVDNNTKHVWSFVPSKWLMMNKIWKKLPLLASIAKCEKIRHLKSLIFDDFHRHFEQWEHKYNKYVVTNEEFFKKKRRGKY